MADDDAKAAQYKTPDPCADTLDVMNKRLSQDLRHRIRKIGNYTPLSPEWRDYADSLSHLSQVAIMEARDAGKREGTVWERDELCVRYVIEEGKTNLLMRSMVDFKKYMYVMEEEEQAGRKLDHETKALLRGYEVSLGLFFRCVLTAVEALQTLDLNCFLEHLERVFLASLAAPFPDEKVQEVLAPSYLLAILSRIEKLDEDKVMGEILDRKLISLMLKHHEQFGSHVGDQGIQDYIWVLCFLVDTEYYQAHRKDFFCDPDDKRRLAALEDAAKALRTAETDADRRKKLRALCDNIVRFK